MCNKRPDKTSEMNVGQRMPKALEMKREPGSAKFGAVKQVGEWGPMERDLVVLIHGFNNDRKSAQQIYNQLLEHYRSAGVPPHYLRRIVPFFWPAYRDWWIRGASYPQMINDTTLAAGKLADFLTKYFEGNRTTQVTFVAHSLGCMLVLEALLTLLKTNPKQGRHIKHACLMAAAVPVSALTKPTGALNGIMRFGLNFSGIASAGDWTLASIFRLGGLLSANRVSAPAVGFKGLPKELWTDDCEHLSIGHTQYWSSSRVAQIVAGKITMPVARALISRDFGTAQPALHRLKSRKIGR
jgi:pimeloyl-ACP methyl ester carboxylesterase